MKTRKVWRKIRNERTGKLERVRVTEIVGKMTLEEAVGSLKSNKRVGLYISKNMRGEAT